ncbi:hypothetical protein QFZ53_000763 [Microbacterium natoriense]|uniref:Cell division protein FtsK n=1 Tax=Microbacterium natoriense TaxID=284570 RepID=A0AAW8ETF1_9MICO|nr:hypothetical protein [Microbacterium natoriense]MDQ0646567.1 hypothetical protein [Microbacterium natoriense]
MPLPQTSPSNVASSALPGATVIEKIRRLVIVSVIAAFAYAVFMTANRGYCAGGFDAQGGFIDASGRAVDQAPRCVELTLGASPLLYAGIALFVVLAIGRATNASTAMATRRSLNRSAFVVVGIVVFAIVVSQMWFQLVPIEGFASGGGSIFSPFPFGIIDVETTPMTTP